MSKPSPEIRFYFFHGKGSSGKDTQADSIIEGNPKAVKISTGDLLRKAKETDNRHHEFLSPYLKIMRDGGLISDNVITEVVRREIEIERAKGVTDFVFTGFPRTEGQLNTVDKMILKMREDYPVRDNHVYFSVLDNTARRRAQKRRDEASANEFEIREDDEPEVVEKRLSVFNDSTLPMIQKLLYEGRLHVVSAGKSVEEVREVLELKLRSVENAREAREKRIHEVGPIDGHARPPQERK
jgi:adenylate kinase